MVVRRSRRCALLAAVLALAACTTTVTGSAVAHSDVIFVQPNGMAIDPALGVSVDVGPGSPSGSTVAFTGLAVADGSGPPWATPVGAAVSVEPSAPRPGGSVRMRFDPARGLPKPVPGRPAADIGNVYVAVLDDASQTWLPLVTRFDPVHSELVATTPHFSTFATFVTKPGRSLLHVAGR